MAKKFTIRLRFGRELRRRLRKSPSASTTGVAVNGRRFVLNEYQLTGYFVEIFIDDFYLDRTKRRYNSTFSFIFLEIISKIKTNKSSINPIHVEQRTLRVDLSFLNLVSTRATISQRPSGQHCDSLFRFMSRYSRRVHTSRLSSR